LNNDEGIQIKCQPRGIFAAQFNAMASPCEVLIETDDAAVVHSLAKMAAHEAWRIERKYSRYLPDSVVSTLNRAGDTGVTLDEESVALIKYAERCYMLSDGLFDITSGVLRRIWKFDGGRRVPTQTDVDALLPFVGFNRLRWNAPQLVVPTGMEIDLGGIGKEYAVDRALALIVRQFDGAVLVNFGGDLRVNRAPRDGPWQVGVEQPGRDGATRLLLELAQGALATSGSTRRFVMCGDVRYGHILNPKTGWPVPDAPLSITVAAGTCAEAGIWSTLAMLQGANAEAFLEPEGLRFWCLR